MIGTEKWVENRCWQYMPSYRGPLAIHAGKGTQYLSRDELREYPTGAIVAVAELLNCLRPDVVRRRLDDCSLTPDRLVAPEGPTVEEFLAHEHTEGPLCLVLGKVRKLKQPVQCKGALGLWNVPNWLKEMILEEVE